MHAECYFAFTVLMKDELRLLDKHKSFMLQRSLSLANQHARSKTEASGRDQLESLSSFKETRTFNQKLWIIGQEIGTVSGKFTLVNFPILQQMQVGVMTVKGIQIQSMPVLFQKQGLVFFKRRHTDA